ncbi:unnamed protein product [Microthlaspi erraticum]|uniref:FBD domain-containing protein n=1 Tax=Microthlaspi erraticum TaxID=1685480 RepID=A0A6D2JP17_9BRAS|nr:unnamed protein product [Microthlaspi erraticum]
MDKIIGFSDDELLLKILTYLPTKDSVRTSVLSKQWKFLWMRVPKLEYDDTNLYYRIHQCICKGDSTRADSLLSESQRMWSFIDKSLALHRSPVMESLCLALRNEPFQPKDITSWVELAVSRSVRELSIDFYRLHGKSKALLPSSLYTCKSLVTLKLQNHVLVDVPHVVRLPSLKTLHLRDLPYADEGSLQRLLSSSPVLEDLFVHRITGDKVKKLAVTIPSLLSLSLDVIDGCVIDTPCLKYFKVKDYSRNSSYLVVNMPKLEEAEIRVFEFRYIKKLLKAVTSVKRLSLHLVSHVEEVVYGDDMDFVFNELMNLKLDTYRAYWSKLLFSLIKGSPKLRDLTFHEQYVRDGMDTMVCWKQLTSVPQCLLSSLQTFKWRGYDVSMEGKDMAKYVLRNSCRLKTARLLTGSVLDPQKKIEMIKELELCSRASTTCNLVLG